MITNYSYLVSRAKGPISLSKIKKELLKEKGLKCYLCGKEVQNKRILELEHKIPVFLGGKIFSKSNLDLACLNCHRIKTIADKHIIKALKTLGIIEGSWIINSMMNFEELARFYLTYFPYALERASRDPWGEEPERIRLTTNREVEDGKNPN